MCIIAAKPAGTPMPSDETLRNMWDANPDGAGFMYPTAVKKNGKTVRQVTIEKGYMDYDKFRAALDELGARYDLTALPLVMHFRITTHGGTCPELTHPFPVTGSAAALRKLRSTARLGIAHNGVIHSVSPGKGMSDTAEYVRTQLAPLTQALPRWYESPPALELVKNAIGSKMAVLDGWGKIVTIGKFEEADGLLYSNSSYLPRTWTYYGSRFGGWSCMDCGAPVKLMPIDSVKGSYVTLRGGHLMDSDINELAIDAGENVYSYDGVIDGWVLLPGASARTPNGAPLRYKSKLAVYEDVYTEDEALALYDAMPDYGEELPWPT